jgi:predicted RND superfamily exporter protein
MKRRTRIPRAMVAIGLRYPKGVLLFWLSISLLSMMSLTRLVIETSTNSILNRTSPEWKFYKDSQERFGGDEIISILIDSKAEYDIPALNDIRSLSDSLKEIPGVWRVDSLSTVPLIRIDADGNLAIDPVLAREVVGEGISYTQLVEDIRRDRIAPRLLISEDGRYLALNLILESGTEGEYENILNEVESRLEDRPAWVSGVPIFRRETDAWTRRELIRLVPVTVVVIAILSVSMLRQPMISLLPLATSGIGSLALLSIMALSGTPLTISTVILPSVMLALGCAYSMHLFTGLSETASYEERVAILGELATPIALSGLTTAIGFLAIGFVKIESIQDVARFGALGVVVVLCVTLTMIPALVVRISPSNFRTTLNRRTTEAIARRLVRFASRRRKSVVCVWVLAVSIAGIGLLRLSVQTDVILWFPEEHNIRLSYDAIRTHLSGISPMNVVISGGEPGAMTSPEGFQAISGLANHLEGLDEVGRALSYAEPIIQLATVLGNAVPTTRSQVEQYLLLLESSEIIGDLITSDRSMANISLRVNENGSDRLLGISEKVDVWWKENGPAAYDAKTTGVMFEFARSQQAITIGQIQGLLFVLVAVGLILVAYFRHAGLAAAALVVNAIPIILGFGAMGFLAIPIDAGTVVVGSIAFGIGVDDTIHTAAEYSSRIARGTEPSQAIFETYARVFRPVVYTTGVVVGGFLVLGFSEFALIRNLGMTTAAVMVVCLVADILLFPSLLFFVQKDPSDR